MVVVHVQLGLGNVDANRSEAAFLAGSRGNDAITPHGQKGIVDVPRCRTLRMGKEQSQR